MQARPEVLTPEERRRLRELLRKGAIVDKGYTLRLNPPEWQEFQVLVKKTLAELEDHRYVEFLSIVERLEKGVNRLEKVLPVKKKV